MRVAAALLGLLMLAPILPASGQTGPAAVVVVSEVLADPDTTAGQREFIELWNPSSQPVALAGWKIRDAPTASGSINTFTFPAWSLAAGGRVVVWGGGAGDGRGPAWSNPTVWNNAGDGVSVIDAGGAIVDWFGYGSAVPPASHANQTVPPAAPRGQSLQLRQGEWSPAAPTPGTAPGAITGSFVVDVANAAPFAMFSDLAPSVRPGAPITVSFTVSDPNGDADIQNWTLASGAGVLARGTTAGANAVLLNAPPSEGPWQLNLTVIDAAGASGTASGIVAVRASDLVVVLPPGPMRFALGEPGGADIVAGAPVELRNEGATALAPMLDISGFSGPDGSAGFASEDRIVVGWTPVGSNTTWLPYDGPLTPLPAIAPGSTVHLWFALRALPVGVPAGSYGASFALVAP